MRLGNLYYIYHAYTDEVPGEQNGQDIYFRSDEIFHIPGLGFNGLVGFSPYRHDEEQPGHNAGGGEIRRLFL